MGSQHVNQYLTYPAVQRHVSASTQNQALSALLFLFRKLLDTEITLDAARAKKPQRLPVVLSVDEVRRVLSEVLLGPLRMMAGLMYGAGLWLMETRRLRVKDVDMIGSRSSSAKWIAPSPCHSAWSTDCADN